MSFVAKCSAPDDLEWYYSRGYSVVIRATPIERSHHGPPEDPENNLLRKARVERPLRALIRSPGRPTCIGGHTDDRELRRCPNGCIVIAAQGWALETVLASYYGGPVDLLPIDRTVVAFLAQLTGATNESEAARIVAARRRFAEAKAAMLAAKKGAGSQRTRRIDKGMARRALEEAARVIAIVYGSPGAQSHAPSRETWSALPLDEQRRALGWLHAAALAAYREAESA